MSIEVTMRHSDVRIESLKNYAERRMLQLKDAPPVNRVERNRRVIGARERVGDRRGHESARPHLKENAIAIGMHPPHGLLEAHRLRPPARDVVARGIWAQQQKGLEVFLDARCVGTFLLYFFEIIDASAVRKMVSDGKVL